MGIKSQIFPRYMRIGALVLLCSLWILPRFSLAGSFHLPPCQQAGERDVSNIEQVFVRTSQSFKSEADAEEFIQDIENETGASFHSAFCPFGLELMSARYFSSVVESEWDYLLDGSDSFEYLQINLCLMGREQGEVRERALQVSQELGAKYLGFEEVSQCHYVEFNSVITREDALIKKSQLENLGFADSLRVFASDVWVVLGKGVSPEELKLIKQRAGEMGIDIKVFHDSIYEGI